MSSVIEGLLEIRRGALDEAESIFAGRLRKNPAEAESLRGLALICLERNNADFAVELLVSSLTRNPRFVEARCDLARIFISRAQHADALAVLEVDPDPVHDYSEVLLLRGNALRAVGRLEEALLCYQSGYAPEHHVEFSVNQANVLADLKRFDEAERVLTSVIGENPDNDHALFNYSLLQLRLGRFETGWPLQEKRPQKSSNEGWSVGTLCRTVEEKSAGGQRPRVLLYSEQGLGDVIQYLRFAHHPCFLPADVTLHVPAPLRAIVENNFPEYSVEANPDVLKDRFELKASLLSLPAGLGLRGECELASQPYLRAPSERVTEIRSEVRGLQSQRCIGIQWRGGGNPKLVNRSMPLELLAPLIDANNRVISLRQDPTPSEVDWLANEGVIRLDHYMTNFVDTAAVIENLDLVVTIDTSIAHLAGAMGKKTFLLLPYSAAWIWMEGRSDSPWYGSITLIRQPRPGDWGSCMAELIRYL